MQSGINNLAPHRINKLAPASVQSEKKGDAGPGQDEEGRCKGREIEAGRSRRAPRVTGGGGGGGDGGWNCERSPDRVAFLTAVHI